MQFDRFDTRILAALQEDARLTNSQLAEMVNLSPSQCSRRRARLEDENIISGYHAFVDRSLSGFNLVAFVSVSLTHHDQENAEDFGKMVGKLPQILEAHALTGDMDYIVKIIATDLEALSNFVNQVLLPHPAVQNVKTSIALETVKETSALPL